MRSFTFNTLDHGAPIAVKAASIAASTVLFIIVALPALALAARIVA